MTRAHWNVKWGTDRSQQCQDLIRPCEQTY
jgi:hypothetical protein